MYSADVRSSRRFFSRTERASFVLILNLSVRVCASCVCNEEIEKGRESVCVCVCVCLFVRDKEKARMRAVGI